MGDKEKLIEEAKSVMASDTFHLIKEHIVLYSVFKELGDVKGKEVLVLGCGNGEDCHKLAEKGASKVVGVGVAEEMVELAKKSAVNNEVESFKLVDSFTDLAKIGEFDFIMSTYTLPSIKSYDMLLGYVKSAFDHLKPGGKICGTVCVCQPHIPKKGVQKFGACEMSWDLEGEEEWTPITLIIAAGEITDDNPHLPTYASRIFMGTPERALTEAGFENVDRKELELSEEGKGKIEEPNKEDGMQPYRYIFCGTKPL